jgi:MFS family permease
MTEFSSTSASGAAGGNSRALWSLLVSFFFSWVSYTGSVALIGWLIFERTRSPAVVSIAFALRFVPMAFTGVLAGVLSDRFGRRSMLVAANGAQALLSFALAIAAGVHWATAPVLILAAGAYGVADSVRLVSGMNLTYDLSHRSHPLRGMAWANLVISGGQALGALLTTGVLSSLGPSASAAAVGAVFVIGAVLAARVEVAPPADQPDRSPLLSSVKAGLGLLGHARTLTLLFCVAVIAEWFAFSGAALDPVFAGSVFVAGPLGLGLILLARAVGRIAGSGLLIWQGHAGRTISWIAVAVGFFGVFLVAFATAPTFPLALLFTCGAGAAAAIVDVGEQTAMQASVDASVRGRAAGLWVLAVGLGPLGVLEVGILAQAVGARAAQAINGAVVVLFGVLLVVALIRRVDEPASSAAEQSSQLGGRPVREPGAVDEALDGRFEDVVLGTLRPCGRQRGRQVGVVAAGRCADE